MLIFQPTTLIPLNIPIPDDHATQSTHIQVDPHMIPIFVRVPEYSKFQGGITHGERPNESVNLQEVRSGGLKPNDLTLCKGPVQTVKN
jgi:hypothetical protein